MYVAVRPDTYVGGLGMRAELIWVVAALTGVAACGGDVRQTNATGERLPSLEDVSAAQWAALAERRIFFGHQSVGRNIMDGVADVLAAHPEIRLTVVDSKALGGASGFYHANVGRNEYPLEKADELVRVVDQAFVGDSGIAMVKFCYVDVRGNTNAQTLLDQYRQRMESLRARHPKLTIVHFTMPLTMAENWKGALMNRLRGQPSERDRNAVRARYNALLLAHYGGKEPVFDIARLESTRPDGSRNFFLRGADTVYAMVPEYTNDGGHLNASARRMVAEQLLVFLARLAPAAPVTAAGAS